MAATPTLFNFSKYEYSSHSFRHYYLNVTATNIFQMSLKVGIECSCFLFLKDIGGSCNILGRPSEFKNNHIERSFHKVQVI